RRSPRTLPTLPRPSSKRPAPRSPSSKTVSELPRRAFVALRDGSAQGRFREFTFAGTALSHSRTRMPSDMSDIGRIRYLHRVHAGHGISPDMYAPLYEVLTHE